MLYRLIYASELAHARQVSTLDIAHILGESERNNRRDEVTGGVIFQGPHILQGLEGRRGDLDRLMRRITADPRHRNIRILIDKPTTVRRFNSPLCLCTDARALLGRAGLSSLSAVTADDVETLLDARQAA